MLEKTRVKHLENAFDFNKALPLSLLVIRGGQINLWYDTLKLTPGPPITVNHIKLHYAIINIGVVQKIPAEEYSMSRCFIEVDAFIEILSGAKDVNCFDCVLEVSVNSAKLLMKKVRKSVKNVTSLLKRDFDYKIHIVKVDKNIETIKKYAAYNVPNSCVILVKQFYALLQFCWEDNDEFQICVCDMMKL